MPKFHIIILAASFIISSFSCNTVEPPDINLLLELEDVSSTEVWLKLTANNLSANAVINIKQDDAVVKQIESRGRSIDTVLFIESLLPKHNYSFSAGINTSKDANKISATTLDTSSHDYIWQTFEFSGGRSYSSLYDIAVIDKNDIWAVGEIYKNDSLGNPETLLYNAVHWDGTSWEYKRISVSFFGNIITPHLEGIYAFSSTDIWVMGGLPIHGDGNKWKIYDTRSMGSVSKAWGTSSNNMYFVGRAGSLIVKENSTWRKIDGGTDKDLTDIYGTPDGKHIWVSGWDYDHNPKSIILEVHNSNAEIIWDGVNYRSEYFGTVNTVWGSSGEFWLGGGEVYRHSILYKDTGKRVRITTTQGSKPFDPESFTLSIRGTGKNNIFIAGESGSLWHFNGGSWHKYVDFYDNQDDRRIYGLSVKENIIAAAGYKANNAWLIVGKK